jgi:signal transduction histidine kinase
MDRLRTRTTLLIPLLVLFVAWAVVSLLILRTIVQRQIYEGLASDLQHSVATYQNLQQQRREMIFRESALLADLPTIKALMTAPDSRTIEDGGAEFWRMSGSDVMALFRPSGELVALYNRGTPLDRPLVESKLQPGLQLNHKTVLICSPTQIYEVSTQPLVFGDDRNGSLLGYIAVGYAIDEHVAREVSQAAAADVAFYAQGRLQANTLPANLQQSLEVQVSQLFQAPQANREIRLGDEHYLAASVALAEPSEFTGSPAYLIVLKSIDKATVLLQRVNQWVVALVILALIVGGALIVSISRSITRPLAVLVAGTRALGQGNFDYQMSEDGAEEVRELSRAFDRMREQLRRSQKDLLDSERLATIGRMARSISHDLRHYLSAIYANAEFLSDSRIAQEEREDLLREVQSAIQGMTDLLDSLLLFTRTGCALQLECESVALMIQRAASLVHQHPAARNVRISLNGLSSLEVWMDSKKLGRAVYNLLLNGCQAARRSGGEAVVVLTLDEDESFVRISVADNGPGISESIRQTMFHPFVSEGNESGVGLGLTLTQQIAQEHGGYVVVGKSESGETLFTIVLPKAALRQPANGLQKDSMTIERQLT